MRFIVAIISIAICAGCVGGGKVRHVAESPKVDVNETGSVSLSGDAEKPAKVETDTSRSLIQIPEGSTFVFNEKLGTMTLMVSKATSLAVNRTETVVEGPKSFTPDKAPTIKEQLSAQSDAKLNLYYGIGAAIGFISFLFGLVRHWDFVMYGGGAVSAGCLAMIWIIKHPALFGLIGGGLALAGAGVFFWHFKLKKLGKNENPNV